MQSSTSNSCGLLIQVIHIPPLQLFHTNPHLSSLSFCVCMCLFQSHFFPSSSLLFTSGPYQLPFLLFPMLCTCRENKAKCGGICVANHTSPMDAAMLATANCFTLVGFHSICYMCIYMCRQDMQCVYIRTL